MSLSDYIESNLEDILKEWEGFARTQIAGLEMSRKEARNDAALILKSIAADMRVEQSREQQEAKSKGRGEGCSAELDQHAEGHALQRLELGFDLNQLVGEYRALRASVLRLWRREKPGDGVPTMEELTRFNEGLDQALAASVTKYAEHLDKSRTLLQGLIAHDLRSPLGAMTMSAMYLMECEDMRHEQTKAAARILKSGNRLDKLLHDLLDVTSTRLGGQLQIRKEKFDLGTIAHETVDEVQAYHPNSTLKLKLEGDLYIFCDKTRLGQMISNLLENAVRYGDLSRDITVAVQGEADRVFLSVHNFGEPIKPAMLRRIFDPLVKEDQIHTGATHAGSFGLGLYIVRMIVEAHQGSIEVSSTGKDGTRFVVYLPRRH